MEVHGSKLIHLPLTSLDEAIELIKAEYTKHRDLAPKGEIFKETIIVGFMSYVSNDPQ